jgi:hypothetical protein
VSFQEAIQKQQYYNGNAQQTEGYYMSNGQGIVYVPPRNITLQTSGKPIISELPHYLIDMWTLA